MKGYGMTWCALCHLEGDFYIVPPDGYIGFIRDA